MIVFSGLDGVRRATPMADVERLIEVAVADVGRGSGRPHIVVDDVILALHGFEPGVQTESIDVLVLSVGGTKLAFASAGSIGTSNIDLASASMETGRHLVLLDGAAVELLDLAALAGTATAPRPTCRLPNGDSWSREVLRPLVESAGYRVVNETEQNADLEILVGDDTGASTGTAAGEILLIGGKGNARKTTVETIDRDDRAALTAALRAASGRSAR